MYHMFGAWDADFYSSLTCPYPAIWQQWMLVKAEKDWSVPAAWLMLGACLHSQQLRLTSSSLTQAAGAATLSHSSPISSSQKLIPEASPSCCLNAQEQKFAIIFCLEKHLKLGYTCLALSQLCFLSLSTCSVAHCSCQDLAQLIKSLVSAQAQ